MAGPNEKLDRIFGAALELSDPAERAAYLQQACGGDEALRRQVESVLAAHERAGDFLETPASGALFGSERSGSPGEGWAEGGTPNLEKGGDDIGRYKLLEQIGEGGFGVVWMAEQTEPVRRRVALKVIKLGMDTRQVVARFEAERQTLALMDHPNIAKVFDGGATESGRPYFVMELVRGIAITEYCDRQNLPMRQRLELFIQVCQAVQHAHQKGIIHRDLKPSNVLVTLHDGVPVPKVIDFGIAKATEQPLTDRTFFTRFHQFLGTPACVSPEQAESSGLDIDTRSDIYSLGVLLYELLTGRTPFESEALLKAGFDEMRRTIREKEPLRPSTRLSTMRPADLTTTAHRRRIDAPKLLHLLRGDLDWIVMKCLEKDRTRRYETANGLVRDVQRHLNHEPVVARPPSRLYRLRKLVRRNRALFAAAALTITSLILGLSASTWLLLRERKAHRAAHAAETRARENLWQAYLAQARGSRTSGQAGRRFESLDALAKAADLRPSAQLRNEAIAALALPDIRVSRRLPGTPDMTPAATLEARSARYARVDRAGNIFVRRLRDDSPVTTLPGFGRAGAFLRLSTDGRYLAAKYDDYVLLVWDLGKGEVVLGMTNALADVALDFHPQKPLVAIGHPGSSVGLYSLPSGTLQKRVSIGVQPWMLRFSPQGDWLAASSTSGASVVVVVDWAEGTILHKLPHETSVHGLHEGGTYGIAWHPDGHLLASGGADRRVYLWEAREGKLRSRLTGHTAAPVVLAFHPGGDLLASRGWDTTIYLWDLIQDEALVRLAGKSPCLEFVDTGEALGLISEGNTLSLLEVAGQPACRTLVTDSRMEYRAAAFSPDARVLALTGSDGVTLWDVARRRGTNAARLKWSKTVEFTRDGRDLIVCSDDVLHRWPVTSPGEDRAVLRFGPPERYDLYRGAITVSLIAGSRRVAVAGSGSGLILDLERPTERTVLSGHLNAGCVSTSPDGRWIATGAWPSGGAVVWDAHTGKLVHRLPVEGTAVVCFSPDGRWLVVGAEHEYVLFAVGTWTAHRRLAGEPSLENLPAIFSPEARLLVLRNSAETLQLIDPADGRELGLLPALQANPLCFSPDGTLLVVSEGLRTVRLWDLRRLRSQLAKLNLDWDQPPYPPAPAPAHTPALQIEVVPQIP